jgi:uncharacterized protein (DUF111 family)
VPILLKEKNFTVRCKIVKHNETIKHFKIESDDIKLIADSLALSFKDTSDLISDQVKQRLNIK